MFLKEENVNILNTGVKKRIKNELMKIFKEKGISVSEMNVYMDEQNINIKVCLNEDRPPSYKRRRSGGSII